MFGSCHVFALRVARYGMNVFKERGAEAARKVFYEGGRMPSQDGVR